MRVSVIAAAAAMVLLAGCSGWMDDGSRSGSRAGVNTGTNPGAGGTGSAGALSGSSESGSLSTGPRGATMQESPGDRHVTPRPSAKPGAQTQ